MAKCVDCGKSRNFLSPLHRGRCDDCLQALAKTEAQDRARKAAEVQAVQDQQKAELLRRTESIILTTETAHDLPVAERLGIVASEVVIGMHIFRDIGAVLRDVFGGRSGTMQQGLKELREAALEELKQAAAQLGADAVVAVDLDYSEISGGGKNMLFLVASGTAVKLRSDDG